MECGHGTDSGRHSVGTLQDIDISLARGRIVAISKNSPDGLVAKVVGWSDYARGRECFRCRLLTVSLPCLCHQRTTLDIPTSDSLLEHPHNESHD